MDNKICMGYFSDFKGEDSILISVDLHGLLELEDVFLKLADGLAKFSFTDLKLLDHHHRIDLIAYCDKENFGLRNVGDGKFEWRATKAKWSEFREKLTTMYRLGNGGHHYLDSDPTDNKDLQVVFSWNEYDYKFWLTHHQSERKKFKEKYKTDFSTMTDFVNSFDPCGLIHAGAPSDEYDCLTQQLLSYVYQKKSKDDMRNLVLDEIENHFGTPDLKVLDEPYKSQFNKDLEELLDSIEKRYYQN
jgi:hypothetical protein